jgi:hypothetical protein
VIYYKQPSTTTHAWLLFSSLAVQTPTKQATQSPEEEIIQNVVSDTLWTAKLTMLRDVSQLYIRSLNNRQNEFKTISDTSAPIIYNTNNNIHIWLAQIEDYLDAKQITTDKQKQQLVLDRLDKTSRQLISDLVKQNKIKNYQQMEDHLKSLYGPSNQCTNDYILEFTQRRQHQKESLAQFFKSLTELARNAYPRTPKDVLDTYIKRQFIIGLHVQAVRDQLLLHDNDDIKNADILTKAVELQNKLFSVNTYTNNNSPNNSNYSNSQDHQQNAVSYTRNHNSYTTGTPSNNSSYGYKESRYHTNDSTTNGSYRHSNKYQNSNNNRDNNNNNNSNNRNYLNSYRNQANTNNKSNENRIQNQQQLNQKPDPSIQSHHTDTRQ